MKPIFLFSVLLLFVCFVMFVVYLFVFRCFSCCGFFVVICCFLLGWLGVDVLVGFLEVLCFKKKNIYILYPCMLWKLD